MEEPSEDSLCGRHGFHEGGQGREGPGWPGLVLGECRGEDVEGILQDCVTPRQRADQLRMN